ncbi:hypothetical protein B0A49_01264 [Cryomyces minteri]|uniref:Uncharacterized protein n=1 Tax=Cryomyces minteri TaxID=331657 RepID=A0A4U0XV62_9PEZI|nr:hypothetical protein B0A49_01264 [Cryomyces minteri]
MATAHPTSPVPGPADPPSPYLHPVIQEILTALTTDGYSKLLDTLMDVEKRMAVDPRKSRLLYIADSFHYAMWLLCSIPKRALIALLDGTFVEKLKYDRDWRDVERRLFKNSISADAKIDPGCYLNQLTTRQGQGFTKPQWEEIMLAMEICVGLKDDEDGELNRNGHTVQETVQHVYRWRRSSDYRKKGAVPNTFEDFLPTYMEDLEEQVQNFVTINRAKLRHIPSTLQQPIHLPAEVGWTWTLRKRLNEQKSMTSTPILFILVCCVLEHLYPHQIHLCQVVIFRPAYWQMAAIGESMLSQLAGSYGSYGGFNLTQAGLSVSSAMQATVSDWNHIQTNLEALGVFDIAKQNSGDEARELEDRVVKAKALVRADELRAKVKARKLELVALKEDLARAKARKEDSYRRLDYELDKVERRIERRAELRRVLELERSCLEGLKRVSLRDWNADVALVESKGK